MNFKYIVGVFLILAVFVPLTTFGATIKVGDTYTFQEGETLRDNLYIGAGEVASDGNVFGDLLIGGGSVTVTGNVSGDATIAGGDISVLERVQGDLRIVGGDILVTENVTGDLMVVGGNVRVLAGATVGKDLVVLGGRVVVQGNVNGKVRVIGGEVVLDSKINGNVDIKASDGITVGDNAIIMGDLLYSGEDESVLAVSEKAVIAGETIFKEGKIISASTFKTAMFAFFSTFLLIKLITILVVVALATIFLKKFSNNIAKSAVEHLGKKTLWGFISLIVIPVAVAIFFASVFGIALGLLGLFGYIMLLVLAGVYSGVIFGAWMDKLVVRKQEEVTVDWKNGVLGVVALTLIIQIPIIGGLAGFFFLLLSLGSISTLTYNYLWTRRK
ncbi:hypothetical protein HON59_00720 [bacterium]|nr:hypothetical protein [bacterium]MBT3730297.1 hypothetical protein [bacterium]MBT4894575.1 hypothetical protein [bacterium]